VKLEILELPLILQTGMGKY